MAFRFGLPSLINIFLQQASGGHTCKPTLYLRSCSNWAVQPLNPASIGIALKIIALTGKGTREISGSHGGEVYTPSIVKVIALMMEAVRTSETSVNFCQTTWRNIPEHGHLYTFSKVHTVHVQGVRLCL
jgi:hypothetical protein